MKTEIQSNTEKILIVNLGGIGDLLLSTAALTLLRKKYRSARIDLLVTDRCADFMKTYGIFDTIYAFSGNDAAAAFRILLRLRKVKYGLAVNMRTIVTWLSAFKLYALFKTIGAARWAGRNTDNKGFFFDVSIPETYAGERLEYEYDIELMRELGVDITAINIHIPSSPADTEHAGRLILQAGIEPSDFVVGVNPGGQPSHQWPAERFVELIKRVLSHDEQVKVVLTGSASEKALCRNIRAAVNSPKVIDLSGATTISQLACLMKIFNLYISNDTGSMHICIVENTPGIFLFGGGNMRRFAPYKNPERFILLHGHTACSPCENIYCTKRDCLKDISAAEVFNAVTELRRRVYAG